MPAVSERQRRFMMAEMTRAMRGQHTETGMSVAQLRDYKHVKKQKPKRGSVLRGER